MFVWKEGKGIEETARDERYRFFDSLASEFEGKTLIATAHNADDNLETVLFNLFRGSGTHGLTGIPPVRDGKYIRPLILCASADIREFCRENGISFNVDCTNNDTEYTRNYIRQRIVPLLAEVSGNPTDAVLRMCSILRSDDDFINSCADDFLSEHGNGVLSAESVSSLHSAVLSRVIDRLYRKAGGKRALSKVHVDSVKDALKSENCRVLISLPDGVVFQKTTDSVSFAKGIDKIDRLEGVFPLFVDGEPFVFDDYAVTASTEPSPSLIIEENIYNLSIYKLTNFDKIKKDFYVRGRHDGDVYRYAGMTRKVKKLFSEKKIPPEKRQVIPIIFDTEGIVWIPGFPLRDGTSSVSRVNDGSVCLCFYEKNR